MEMGIDELIVEALKNSEEPILAEFVIRLFSQNTVNADLKAIEVYQGDMDIDEVGNDFDDWKVFYILEIDIKKVDYLEGRKFSKEVVNAIMRALRKKGALTMVYNEGKDNEEIIDYNDLMKPDKIIPEYGDGYVHKKTHLQLNFIVTENYGIEEEEFDTVDMNVEVK